MNKLWNKTDKLNTFVEAFETKGDLLLDQQLIKYDILGSLGQSIMLHSIGILSEKEYSIAKKALQHMYILVMENKLQLSFGDEDMHTKIENFITKEYGKIGKKIHTGRSRNDQVLTALRLFTKDKLLEIWEATLFTAEDFLNFAKKYEFIMIPGYTHMQQAMPSSIGLWSSSYVESFLDDVHGLISAYALTDQSPLGSAAGYGVPLDIDREMTASVLGFKKVQQNTLYCQNSRGKMEASVLSSLVQILMTINKFASDILLFTTNEFDFFTVSDKLITGSSIMPQKKNIDIAELLRSKVHVLLGNYTTLVSLSSNLISGYNRDFQDTKKLLIESLFLTKECLQMTSILINNIKPNEKKIQEHLHADIFTTHKAFSLVKKGIPFRDAYHTAKKSMLDLPVKDILKQSTHIGGTGNLGLKNDKKMLQKQKKILVKEQNAYKNGVKNFLED